MRSEVVWSTISLSIHLSLKPSISPNNNLEPARVEDVEENEVDGFVARVEPDELVSERCMILCYS